MYFLLNLCFFWFLCFFVQGLIIFTSDLLDDFLSGYDAAHTETVKWLTFVMCEHILFTSKQLLIYVIPDIPSEVSALRHRHEFINHRLFNAVKPESSEHLHEVAERLDLTIHNRNFKLDEVKVDQRRRNSGNVSDEMGVSLEEGLRNVQEGMRMRDDMRFDSSLGPKKAEERIIV